jgi:glycosyltransferase involved in cell wall biosynthesis
MSVTERAAAHEASARPTGGDAWRGNLDVVERDRIEGWAVDECHPSGTLRLRISDNGAVIGEVSADVYRADLRAAGIGDGCHAFSLIVPGGLAPDQRHTIEVRRVDDGRALPGSPFVLGAAPPLAVARSAVAPVWRGQLQLVSRDRVEGWAWDERARNASLALALLDNGVVIARALANRFRQDLAEADIGTGRHAFAFAIPGGLAPRERHVIQVIGEADGCEIPGSPVIIDARLPFDAALEQTITSAVGALGTSAERQHALAFLAAQTERVLQLNADADTEREGRLLRWRFEGGPDRGADGVWVGESELPAHTQTARRALVIDDLLPAADQEAAGVAILSHMRALRALGFEVSFVAAESLAPEPRATAALRAQGVRCCHTPFYASVEEVLRRQRDCFDVIYLHRVSNAAKYLALARRYGGKARILYSVADLHHLRLARQADVEGRPELLTQSRQLRLAECSAAIAADAVITHSTAEAGWLRQTVQHANVHVIPWAVPPRPTPVAWAERRGIAFIGNFRFAPNRDAATFLVTQIMPKVWRADPTIECLLVGASMPEELQRLAGPRVHALGYVADLAGLFARVRLTVAPLRFGAGVKGKVLESLAAGVPCVMTPIAAEGLGLPATLTDAVSTDPQSLAEDILRLHAGGTMAEAMVSAGLAYIAVHYTEANVERRLEDAIAGRRVRQPPKPAPRRHAGALETGN